MRQGALLGRDVGLGWGREAGHASHCVTVVTLQAVQGGGSDLLLLDLCRRLVQI